MFEKIIKLGIVDSQSEEVNKKIKLVNGVVFLTSLLIFSFIIFFLITQQFKIVYLLLIILGLQCIPFYFNANQKVRWAKIFFLCSSYIVISSITKIFGAQLCFQYYLIAGTAMPVFFFAEDLKPWVWIMVCIPFPMLILIESSSYFLNPVIAIDNNYLIWIKNYNLFLVGLTVTFMIWHLTRINNQLIQKRDTTNKTLAKSLEDINEGIEISEQLLEKITLNEDILKKDFPDLFIYNQPKDQIGGDFYWVFKQNGVEYYIIFDSSGHGVSGSICSVVIAGILQTIIKNEQITQPHRILTLLHRELLKYHNPDLDNNASISCDIGICVKRETEVLFSGANIDLLINSGSSDVTRVKATKSKVGYESYQDNTIVFTAEKIILQGNEVLLMSTDGLIDQLNERFETFGFEGLNKIIKTIPKSKESERSIINVHFNNWKKNQKQVDDILVIGINNDESKK